jgi:hypothetical protein
MVTQVILLLDTKSNDFIKKNNESATYNDGWFYDKKTIAKDLIRASTYHSIFDFNCKIKDAKTVFQVIFGLVIKKQMQLVLTIDNLELIDELIYQADQKGYHFVFAIKDKKVLPLHLLYRLRFERGLNIRV